LQVLDADSREPLCSKQSFSVSKSFIHFGCAMSKQEVLRRLTRSTNESEEEQLLRNTDHLADLEPQQEHQTWVSAANHVVLLCLLAAVATFVIWPVACETIFDNAI
jgi:hypothetical protein